MPCSPIFRGRVLEACDFPRWSGPLVSVLLVRGSRSSESSVLVEDVVGCYVGFEGSIVQYALSVDNSSIERYPSWDAHLVEGILPLASSGVLSFLVVLAVLDSVPFATDILLVHDLLLWRGVLECDQRPWRRDDVLEQRKALGQ